MSDPNVFEELGFPRDEAADLLRQSDARIIDELRERVAALNRRIDTLQKAKPTFLTDYQRMWDLVRHQRAALVDAGLITALEYALLVSHESTVTNAAGSPSPRRLESYDELRAKLAEVEAERDEARDGGARLHSRMVALEATLTAERERADRAESHANAAETQAGIDRVLRRAAEAENARLLERLRAIDPLVLIEGSEDGFHHYRCVACNRGSRPDHADARHFTSCIFAPTAPTGETR
jgi:hypothetical protein